MRLAAADVQRAAAIDHHAMRSCERAPQRVGLGTISAVTRAEDGTDDAGVEIDRVNDVVLGIRNMQGSLCVFALRLAREEQIGRWRSIRQVAVRAD
jgi:hypothetical protein